VENILTKVSVTAPDVTGHELTTELRWYTGGAVVAVYGGTQEQLAKTSSAISPAHGRIYIPTTYNGPSALFMPTMAEGRSKEQSITEWTPHLTGTASAHDVEGTQLDMDLPA